MGFCYVCLCSKMWYIFGICMNWKCISGKVEPYLLICFNLGIWPGASSCRVWCSVWSNRSNSKVVGHIRLSLCTAKRNPLERQIVALNARNIVFDWNLTGFRWYAISMLTNTTIFHIRVVYICQHCKRRPSSTIKLEFYRVKLFWIHYTFLFISNKIK